MIQKIQLFLLGIALASGPVFWFWGIGKIIALKFVLMLVLFLLYSKSLIRSRGLFFCFFVLASLLYAISTCDYEDSLLRRFVLLYLDLIVAWGFLCIGDRISFSGLYTGIRIAVFCCIGYCAVFWLCYLTGVIQYYPYESVLDNGSIQVVRFSESGWGFGRTQWSTCLSVFVPALILWLPQEDQRKKFWNNAIVFLGFLLIFSVQLVSGGRGGIIASLCSLGVLVFWTSKRKILAVLSYGLILALAAIVFYTNMEFFRLDRDSLSQSRVEQWESLSIILEELPFWGFGDYGEASVMNQFGIPFAFHDSFLRYLFGFGFAGLCEGLFILFLLVRGFQAVLQAKQDKRFIAVLGGILSSGFICSFTEPNPIFVAFYWPLWWVSAGFLYRQSAASIPVAELDLPQERTL